jgi:hypothetical protein
MSMQFFSFVVLYTNSHSLFTLIEDDDVVRTITVALVGFASEMVVPHSYASQCSMVDTRTW